jgi:hypothetical protein
MRNPVLISAAAHVVIVALALVAFPSPEELPSVPTRALPVELVTIDQVTNLKSTKKVDKPKPVEKPEPPKPEEPVKAKAEPKPEPKPTPPPPPEKKAEVIPEKKEEKPKPVEKKEDKKPTPPKKEPEKKFDPSNIAALLDKVPDKAPKSTPLESTEDFEAPATDDPAAALTMSETDALRQHVGNCWIVSGSVGNADAEKLRATVRFGLNPDGSLSGVPVIVKKSSVTGSNEFAGSVIRAIQNCAPYDFLPADKYTSWRDNTFNFDLGGMM